MFKFLLPHGYCIGCGRDKQGKCKVKVIFTCDNKRLTRRDKGSHRIKKVIDNTNLEA